MSQLFQQHDPGEISSGTPLRALSAVCLDTETTGLDTKRDRLIQVGGVRIHRGEIVTADALDALVNPAQPIPESSTRIHGLTDEMVRDAPHFSQYHETLEAWIGSAVLLGYSIGFDLAILDLARECVEKALELAPHDEQARELRTRIQRAEEK